MTDYKLVPVERLKDWHKRINTIAVETAFDVADEMKAMLAAAPDVQGEPVYFWREIGETDWMECRKDWYWKCANSPEHDTKLLYTAPQPAEQQPAPHPDDAAVDRFAAAMKAKLNKKRQEGRGGGGGVAVHDSRAAFCPAA